MISDGDGVECNVYEFTVFIFAQWVVNWPRLVTFNGLAVSFG